ncbi:MAG: ABC transporter ATP-binding protein [Ruminococcaceae bacterium]|nr:ABC transporter ATP-binding protein [Oscillospiraceae bacterium]
MQKELIRLENIVKNYGETQILKGINLYINDSEFLTILGPSGCGKTTTLRVIGGFEQPTQGRVWFDGKEMTHVPPHKRQVNTVFQKYALFTHMNVFENVAFGLRLKKTPNDEVERRVNAMLDMVNLSGYGKRDATSLSGGEQQRVAIARALVNRPKVLLLDEPLGALDLKLRKEMQLELKTMQKQLGITFIYVTHDQEEALTMSDTVVVMNKGSIQQIGTPIDIYNEPKNAFVANFIGQSNIIPGVMNRDLEVTFDGHTFPCVDSGFGTETPVDVVVRPEDVQLVEEGRGQLSGIVESLIFKGVHYEMVVDTGSFHFLVQSTAAVQPGVRTDLLIAPDAIHIMKKGGAE